MVLVNIRIRSKRKGEEDSLKYCRQHSSHFSVRESKVDNQKGKKKKKKGNRQRRNSNKKLVTIYLAKKRKKPSWSSKWLHEEEGEEGEQGEQGEQGDRVRPRGPPVPIRTVLAAAGEDEEEEEEDDSELKITTPTEQKRYEMAQTIMMIFSGSGWDVRLVMHALKACNDDGDLATEWLYGEHGSAARQQMAQIAEQSKGKKISFEVPHSEMEISKQFKLKLTTKEGFTKKFKVGEWVGMYQLKTRDNGTVVEPDDHDIYLRTCYKQLTKTDRERGWVLWNRSICPDRPGMYQFRYFGSKTDKRKWGTSEPLPFKYKCPTTDTLVDAAMLLTALQPVANDLARLAALVHAESEAQDVHPMQLDPHTLVLTEEKRAAVMLKATGGSSGSSGTGLLSLAEIKERIPIVQGFNACICEILPAVDFSMAGESKYQQQ